MSRQHDKQKELIEAIKIDVNQPQAVNRFKKKLAIKLSLVAFALMLILSLGFVISAKTVVIEILPIPDEVNLSAGSIAIKLQDRYLAQPGKYQLTASKQGYYPLNEKVNIGVLPYYTFKRVLQKKPGIININVKSPERARAYIDDRYIGVTPLQDIILTPGTHSIELQRYRYQTLWSELQVEGAGKRQDFSFDMFPNWSVVSIDSKPSDAQVWINGERYENTPAKLELNASTYHLEVVHPDFSAHISDFVVLPNQFLDLGVIRLDRNPSYFIIKSQPAGAVVYVNNKQQGITPLTIKVTPNTDYHLIFEKSGYRSLSREVKVAASESETISVGLKPILSTVHLEVIPSRAEVIIDGISRGYGNQTLPLTTASHKIEVKESGYKPYVLNITPKANQPTHKKIILELRQNKQTETPEKIINSQGQHLKLIMPGEFVMGTSRREQGRRANEVLRKVKLTRKYYIGINEVTNEEFSRFDPSHNSGVYSGVTLSASKLPVTNVTWEQAAQYCNWLSRKEDLPVTYYKDGDKLVAQDPILNGYRLVTEAEWSWVARIKNNSSPLRYAWGDQYPPKSNWLNGNYADKSTKQIIGLVIDNIDDGFAGPAPVRSFAANHHGLYDIDANVAEWVHDYYAINSTQNSQVFVDPVGPKQGKHHVIRGASWLRGTLSNTRLAYREYRAKPQVDVGFRIARYISQ